MALAAAAVSEPTVEVDRVRRRYSRRAVEVRFCGGSRIWTASSTYVKIVISLGEGALNSALPQAPQPGHTQRDVSYSNVHTI